MTNDVVGTILQVLAIYVIVGIIEFFVSAFFMMQQTYALARQGEIVEWSKVFSAWLSNITLNLVIDAVFGTVVNVFALKR